MNLGRVVGILVLVLVLYAIITQPLNSAAMARSGGSSLAAAGTSVRQFLTSLDFNGPGTSSTTRTGTSSGTRASSYTVRSGDTLSSIAARQGTSVDTLAARNGLADADRIRPGQRLALR